MPPRQPEPPDSSPQPTLAEASLDADLAAVRTAIVETVARRDALKAELAEWYARGRAGRFPRRAELEAVDAELSRQDSVFKALWDRRHKGL